MLSEFQEQQIDCFIECCDPAVDRLDLQFNRKHFPIKEQDGAQRLTVCGCRHLAIGAQMGQERLHLCRTHVARMPHRTAVDRPANEKPHPLNIDLLRAEAIVHASNALAQLIQHTGRLQRRIARLHGILITGFFIQEI